MEKFNDIQSAWTKQVDATLPRESDAFIKIANQKIKTIRRNHIGTIAILSTTATVLLFYYWWIFNATISGRILGLQLMILMLIGRVILEIMSIIQFYKIDFTTDYTTYIQQLKSFYKLRKVIHFIITPIIYIVYIVGFTSMLPLFKENFSVGFYNYILISGFGFLILFSFVILKIIKQDMKNIDLLKQLEEV